MSSRLVHREGSEDAECQIYDTAPGLYGSRSPMIRKVRKIHQRLRSDGFVQLSPVDETYCHDRDRGFDGHVTRKFIQTAQYTT